MGKEEIYQIIKAALAALPRYDEPTSYGIADDAGTGQRIIYFDLSRVSPLQFNVRVPADAAPEEMVELVRHSVAARL